MNSILLIAGPGWANIGRLWEVNQARKAYPKNDIAEYCASLFKPSI